METQEYILRAMAKNYADGNLWDHLDREACTKAADEIARLQEAKRRALHLADERAKEAVTLRAMLLNIQALAEQGNPIDSAKLAMRCRHALNQQLKPEEK